MIICAKKMYALMHVKPLLQNEHFMNMISYTK